MSEELPPPIYVDREMPRLPTDTGNEALDSMANVLNSMQDLLLIYTAHMENLIERMYDIESHAGLHDPCPKCGGDVERAYRCEFCHGSGSHPQPIWDRS